MMLIAWAICFCLADIDAVVLHNGAKISGQIVENDERGVRLRLDGGKEMLFSPAEVKSIETLRTPRHQLGQSSLDRRDYSEALSELRQAREQEKRDWAIREIDRLCYRAFLGKGDLDEAAKLYLVIAESRTDVEWLGEAPLIWAEDETISPAALAAARGWLHEERPLAQLIGASWLIGTAQHEDARVVLDELQTLEPRIGGLARAQLWRAPLSAPTTDDLARWRLSISRLPQPLRGGPMFVLAVAQRRAGLEKESAISYLWVAYVYRPNSPLAARSLLGAGQASMKAGMTVDAQKIWRELMDTFPGSVWAMEAQKKMSESPIQEDLRGP
jgi:tetratricopeptide (TPR) repeat protein